MEYESPTDGTPSGFKIDTVDDPPAEQIPGVLDDNVVNVEAVESVLELVSNPSKTEALAASFSTAR